MRTQVQSLSRWSVNFLNGGAGINVLARHAGADVVVIDIGVNHDFSDMKGLVARKVIRGAKNIRKGPAIAREEAINCIGVGLDLAAEFFKKVISFSVQERWA